MKASVTLGASFGETCTIESTPSGRPASARTSAKRRCVRGDCSDVLRIAVFPAMIGCMTERCDSVIGAFQGAIARLTPNGQRSMSERFEVLVSIEGIHLFETSAKYSQAF